MKGLIPNTSTRRTRNTSIKIDQGTNQDPETDQGRRRGRGTGQGQKRDQERVTNEEQPRSTAIWKPLIFWIHELIGL